MQDVRELLHEALEAVREALDVVRVAVIGDDRRNRGEKTDGGGDERLGDARRHLRERRLLHVREAAERMHDAPHGPEQSDVRAYRAGRGEEGEMTLEKVHLALERGAHGAARAVDHVARIAAGTLAASQLRELAEACLEDALQAADGVAVIHRALIERVEVVSAPEFALELVGLRTGAPDGEPLLEDEHPGHEGDRDEQQHHHLDHDARVQDERPDVEVLGERHRKAFSSSSGTRAGFMRRRSTSASVTSASTRSSVPRSTRWWNTRLARPILATSALTDRRSLSSAGR